MIKISDDAVILVTMSLPREHSCIYIFSSAEFEQPDEYLSELYVRPSIKQIKKDELPFYLDKGYGLSISANAYSKKI